MKTNSILYIGQYLEGTTSKMRAEALSKIIAPNRLEVIDTHIPFYQSHPFWRSLGFRYKRGKLIQQINKHILNEVAGPYKAIWIDKGIFIRPKVINYLRALTDILVHYTPDTAFCQNKSRFFNKGLKYYDFAISTKSFEKEKYLEYIKKNQLLFVPQGFDKNIHFPRHRFSEKSSDVVFIGLYEPSRAEVISFLLKNNISVAVAGKKWTRFNKTHKNYGNYRFLGEGLFGEDYAQTLSKASFSLGLLSKRFPELHTTRTFEIPACGTALITEKNKETSKFYDEDEVIFFKDKEDMLSKINYYLSNKDQLSFITTNGYKKVLEAGGYDYQEQLRQICLKTGIISAEA